MLFSLALLAAALGVVMVRDALRADPADTLDAFLSEWEAGHDRRAAGRTDATRAAATELRANRSGLDGARVEAETLDLSEDGDRATARVRLTWAVPGIGPWDYETRIPLVRVAGDWRVRWTPKLVHPRLDEVTRLGTTRAFAERAPILDRNRRRIVTQRAVKRVGAVVSEVTEPRATADGLASALDVDARPILRQLRGGGPEQFVEALTLRESDYAAVSGELDAVPDVTVLDGTASLAPSREFARALLGTVAPATAEQLGQLGNGYVPGDQVGQWGLQSRFERRLAGTPDRAIVLRVKGTPTTTLFEREGHPGRSLRTTLDERVQAAAEVALGSRGDEAALVALEPGSGDILAIANRPVDSSFDRALAGRYPPGSTFKVVTTAALLRAGLDVDETVDCPGR